VKITDLITTAVAVPMAGEVTASRLNVGPRAIVSVLVELHTDEGLVGLGEAPPVLGADLTEAILRSAAETLKG